MEQERRRQEMDEGKWQGRTLDDSLTIQRFVLVRDEEIFSFVSAVRGRFQGTGSAKNLPRVLAAHFRFRRRSFQGVNLCMPVHPY